MRSLFWPRLALVLGEVGNVAPLPALATLMAAAGRFDGCLPPVLRPAAGWAAMAPTEPVASSIKLLLGRVCKRPALERISKWSATVGSCQGPQQAWRYAEPMDTWPHPV